MKIIQYCQHVLGIGHLVRTLEILKHLDGHEVILVNGGAAIEIPLPDHVREVRLPALVMDSEFNRLMPLDAGRTLDDIKTRRKQLLAELIVNERPDVFLVELFPFGRRAFAFELLPVLEALGTNGWPHPAVICSLRDILVESKKHWEAYQKEVVHRLNTLFNALLVHTDPSLIQLKETFSRTGDIAIPLVNSGFVAQKPIPDADRRARKQLEISDDDKLIVASAGGGRVGESLLTAVVKAAELLPPRPRIHVQVFAGPHMPQPPLMRLQSQLPVNVTVRRFSTYFLSYLAAADLSISMAGYNTCMNILATRTPALVWPFSQNREQYLRASRLAQIGAVSILSDSDLAAQPLSELMMQNLDSTFCQTKPVDLNGAAFSARWIERHAAELRQKYAPAH